MITGETLLDGIHAGKPIRLIDAMNKMHNLDLYLNRQEPGSNGKRKGRNIATFG